MTFGQQNKRGITEKHGGGKQNSIDRIMKE
jgi:hypothetical protein